MVPDDRQKKILSLIEQNHSISVSELKAQLYVSAATIRRDLAELSKRGMIVRSFGGALALSAGAHSATQNHTAESTPIGKSAAELVKAGNTIFLDSSPLTLSMTGLLSNIRGLTVVTDSMSIADVLCGQVASLYCTGGRYLSKQSVFVGRQAAELVEKFRFDQCFISCAGVSPDGQLLYHGVERMAVLQSTMRNSRDHILLCTAAHIGRNAPNALLKLSDIDIIVTDAPGKVPMNFAGTVVGAEQLVQKG